MDDSLPLDSRVSEGERQEPGWKGKRGLDDEGLNPKIINLYFILKLVGTFEGVIGELNLSKTQQKGMAPSNEGHLRSVNEGFTY